jgi:hypothetical protein
VPVIGEFASTTSRRIIANGTAVSNATSNAPTLAPTHIYVGATFTAAAPYSGSIASVAFFAGTASDDLIALHRQGVHPTQLPGALLECWDLDHVGPVVGLVRGTLLSPVAGGSLTPGPMVQGPPLVRRFFVGATTAGGGRAGLITHSRVLTGLTRRGLVN